MGIRSSYKVLDSKEDKGNIAEVNRPLPITNLLQRNKAERTTIVLGLFPCILLPTDPEHRETTLLLAGGRPWAEKAAHNVKDKEEGEKQENSQEGRCSLPGHPMGPASHHTPFLPEKELGKKKKKKKKTQNILNTQENIGMLKVYN